MRKFMVVLDSSTECLNAMRFAAMRAEKTNARVEVLAIIPPEEFNPVSYTHLRAHETDS